MKLEWAAYAVEDRVAIFEYIEADNPRAAAIIDDRIRLHVQQLIRHPESGRIGRVSGTLELECTSCAYCMAHSSGRTLFELRG